MFIHCAPYRIQKVTHQLAAKGYNVTSLSADIDPDPVQNLHYIHLDRVYDQYSSNENDFDHIEMGEQTAWHQAKAFFDITKLACKGALLSSGWKQLQNYPDDFKVHEAFSIIQIQFFFFFI